MNLYNIYSNNNKPIGFNEINNYKELAQHIQIILIAHNLLKPPADGRFGILSKTALSQFQENFNNKSTSLDKSLAELLIETKPIINNKSDTNLDNSPVSIIIKYCINKGYKLFSKLNEVNIIYLEGCNLDFTLNSDQPNLFNDVRLVIKFIDGKPVIVGKWKASTEPGNYYTFNPMNPGGAARLAMGQHLNAWCVGTHLAGRPTGHEGLVQVAPVSFYRDKNKDFKRTGDKLYSDIIGLNQHASWGHGGEVGRWSAGCLIGISLEEHKQFIRECKTDPNYLANKRFRFSTILLDASKVFSY